MWLSLFLLLTFALFLLPLLPSLLELKLATDTQPLQVIQEYDAEPTYFATGFKTWLRTNFDEFFAVKNKSTAENSDGTLPDSTPFQIVGNTGIPTYSPQEIYNTATHKLILSAFALRLTEKMFFESEIYSAGGIETATDSQFRALLAGGDIHMGEGCTVLRWAHSYTSVYAAEGCDLFGRLSAHDSITIAENCRFERLNAATIRFGQTYPGLEQDNTPLPALETLPNIKDKSARRSLIEGDLDIPDNQSFTGDIVTTKNIAVGRGSRIIGNLKSNRDMYLAEGVCIDGSIVSAGNIHIQSGCRIAGPVIAEKIILVEEGSIIGSTSAPTTITAPNILVTSGVTVHGTVWADKSAMVLPVQRSDL
jgi:predicted acyltransferase (DUF342 family)